MNKQLTKAEVQELFDKESILIGQSDCVPLHRAKELFGDGAANYAFSISRSIGGYFGVGDYNLPYLTLRGFQAAASYHNVEMLRDELREVGIA